MKTENPNCVLGLDPELCLERRCRYWDVLEETCTYRPRRAPARERERDREEVQTDE